MPKYVTFFSYSAEAMKAMIHHPSDREAAARALVESLGGYIDVFAWMQGDHDGLLISDIPDAVSVAALAAAVGSTGAITNLETHRLYDHDEQADILEKARKALESYTPPN